MKRILTGAISLGLGLASLSGIASAQTPAGISTNADGSYVSSRAGIHPAADGDGGTVIYGDITTGPGNHVIGVPTVSTEPAPVAEPVDSAPADVPADSYVPADAGYVPEDTAVSDGSGAVASDTDADADNIADALEWDLGLDPGNADTDGDGVADGDEISIYSTDPVTWDTDGDGLSDGEELFGVRTDPLVWDEPAAQPDLTLAQEAIDSPDAAEFEQESLAPTTEPVSLPQGTTQNVTAVDGDAATLGSGGASASPGTVTRGGGGATLGPNGSYVVSDAPSNVTITGDTGVIAPLNESSNASLAPDAGAAYSCGGYGEWYDAQVAYENAGATAADPAMVQAMDPDYDGIACEEGMA
ncbi:MAG: hypothetical protein M3Z20_06660 [Chloroflexota bacterium]|nr:hypothetical protein [Chloroflexota bacterium]